MCWTHLSRVFWLTCDSYLRCRNYGSGYPGVGGLGVANRNFPFVYWPFIWGGGFGYGAAYLHDREVSTARFRSFYRACTSRHIPVSNIALPSTANRTTPRAPVVPSRKPLSLPRPCRTTRSMLSPTTALSLPSSPPYPPTAPSRQIRLHPLRLSTPPPPIRYRSRPCNTSERAA